MKRHKRHIKLLKTLYKLGWSVSACFTKGVEGCRGRVNAIGEYSFSLFNRPTSMTFRAPPFVNADGGLTFVLSHFRGGSIVIETWRGLAKFVQDRHNEMVSWNIKRKENNDAKKQEEKEC